MCNYKFTGAFVDLCCWLLLLLFLLPAGCSTVAGSAEPNAGSIPFPDYEIGTTYVYSNGSWETVADISGHRITWHDHRGNVYLRASDFTYRSINWKTGTGQGSRKIVAHHDSIIRKNTSLWPLQEGGSSSFAEIVTSRRTGEPATTYRVSWTCRVVGRERVAVLAGEFDTWKIACNRTNSFQNPSKATIKETRTWNYAPEINHNVLTQRQYPGGKPGRRLELLAILPPLEGFSDSTRRQLSAAFQKALEHKKRGQATAWSAPDTLGAGRITPVNTFKLADGRYGRRYIQKINYPEGQRIYYGLAVRDSRGQWMIPRR